MTGEALEIALTNERVEDAPTQKMGALFDTHHERLYRLARRLCATADDARDLVQDTFLRAVRSPKSVPSGPPNQEAWLVRILINIRRDQWRKRASKQRFDDRYLPEAQTTVSASAESAVIARTAVWRALEQLAPRRRATIVLFELDGVEIPRIAEMLGISAITVRWHLSRGRKELARIISNQERGSS